MRWPALFTALVLLGGCAGLQDKTPASPEVLGSYFDSRFIWHANLTPGRWDVDSFNVTVDGESFEAASTASCYARVNLSRFVLCQDFVDDSSIVVMGVEAGNAVQITYEHHLLYDQEVTGPEPDVRFEFEAAVGPVIKPRGIPRAEIADMRVLVNGTTWPITASSSCSEFHTVSAGTVVACEGDAPFRHLTEDRVGFEPSLIVVGARAGAELQLLARGSVIGKGRSTAPGVVAVQFEERGQRIFSMAPAERQLLLPGVYSQNGLSLLPSSRGCEATPAPREVTLCLHGEAVREGSPIPFDGTLHVAAMPGDILTHQENGLIRQGLRVDVGEIRSIGFAPNNSDLRGWFIILPFSEEERPLLTFEVDGSPRFPTWGPCSETPPSTPENAIVLCGTGSPFFAYTRGPPSALLATKYDGIPILLERAPET